MTVICGDIIQEMKTLIKQGEKFDCIFADPDYNVGIKYGTNQYKQSFDEYIQWCIEWSKLAYELLNKQGNFFIINYDKNNSHLRVKYLDKVFHRVENYTWIYNTNIGHSENKFTQAHRSILHCTKSPNNKFYKNNVAMPYKNPNDKRIQERIKQGSKGVMPYSWMYFNMVKNVSKDKTNHPCQIPSELSKLLIGACTQPKDKVLILFAGSGNDVISALKLKTIVTAIDIEKEYCKNIEKRIKEES